MKKNIIIAIAVTMLTAGTATCNAQAQQTDKPRSEQSQDPVYEQDKVDQAAQFTGGMIKQAEYMAKNVKYPKEAEKDGASGTVCVDFVVEKDGSLTNVKVNESIHPALDAEAIRTVKAMPKWTAAKIKGKAVRSKTAVYIPFRLN